MGCREIHRPQLTFLDLQSRPKKPPHRSPPKPPQRRRYSHLAPSASWAQRLAMPTQQPPARGPNPLLLPRKKWRRHSRGWWVLFAFNATFTAVFASLDASFYTKKKINQNDDYYVFWMTQFLLYYHNMETAFQYLLHPQIFSILPCISLCN